MNVIRFSIRRACLVPALAVLVSQAVVAYSQTVLIDFGSNSSFRGLSVPNPDINGNYWNSLQPGVLVPLIDVGNAATGMQLGWDTPVATDSYNGPAGATDETLLNDNVLITDIDVEVLGNLGGALEGAFDYASGYDGVDHFPVRFQIQGLNPAATYELTFFGSHKFSVDTTTVYTVYSDSTYTTPVATASLDVQDPDSVWLHNRDKVATISDVSPQTDNILYIEFVGLTGFGGYLNDMQIEASAPGLNADYDDDGDVDGGDLGRWRSEFGQSGPAVTADGDGDDDADGNDFLIWQREMGLPVAGLAAVPEPTGIALLAVGSMALAALGRRRLV